MNIARDKDNTAFDSIYLQYQCKLFRHFFPLKSVKISLNILFRASFWKHDLINSDKNSSCFGDPHTHFTVKVKRDYVVFTLVFQIGPQTAK